ncbi:MAG: amino acid ABC transporter ATP-binding protein [Actinomycetota bacterium]|nr:amino acid ABC transporter ATP-binding protein [Actinomycetota bacterium]
MHQLDTNSIAPSVTFQEVRKAYSVKTVINGITFDVPGGSTTCLIGPSGSGKTTLLRCVNRLERPDSGKILVGNINVVNPSIPLSQIRANIGMVFQNFNLFPHMSVADNVALAPKVVLRLKPEEATELAIAQLERVGLRKFSSAKPSYLSGGQQQRVAIARALAMKPKVILFDEPTSALDPELVQEVLGVMKELSHDQITMIIATHEMKFAQEAADKVVFIDEGIVVEQGSPNELLENPSNPRLISFLGKVGTL